MTDHLLVVALKTDQPNIERRLRTILAATEPVDGDPAATAITVARPVTELAGEELIALSWLLGSHAVGLLGVWPTAAEEQAV